MAWLKFLYYVGFVLGAVVTLLVLVFSVVVLAVHCVARTLSSVGLWIMSDMTLPVLEAVSKMCTELRPARKKSGL